MAETCKDFSQGENRMGMAEMAYYYYKSTKTKCRKWFMCINLPCGEKMADRITVSVFVHLGFPGGA